MGRPMYLTAHRADKTSYSMGNFEWTYPASVTEPSAGSGKSLLETGVDDLSLSAQETHTSTK